MKMQGLAMLLNRWFQRQGIARQGDSFRGQASKSVTLWQPQRVLGEWNSLPQGNGREDGMPGDQLGGLGSQQATGTFNLLSFLSIILPGRPWMFLFHQAKPIVTNSCFGACWGPQILGWEEGGTFWDLPGTAYWAETYRFPGWGLERGVYSLSIQKGTQAQRVLPKHPSSFLAFFSLFPAPVQFLAHGDLAGHKHGLPTTWAPPAIPSLFSHWQAWHFKESLAGSRGQEARGEDSSQG